VLLNRPDRQYERLCDPGVRPPFGHQPQHLALSRRQLLERLAVMAAREELPHDLGV
jgi:hypothetical protein